MIIILTLILITIIITITLIVIIITACTRMMGREMSSEGNHLRLTTQSNIGKYCS